MLTNWIFSCTGICDLCKEWQVFCPFCGACSKCKPNCDCNEKDYFDKLKEQEND